MNKNSQYFDFVMNFHGLVLACREGKARRCKQEAVMKHHLDWSSYETAGQGDAAGIPATGGDFARAVAVCIGDRLCQRTPGGVMCPSFRVSGEIAHSPGARVLALKAALNGELGAAPFADARLAEAMELCVGCPGLQARMRQSGGHGGDQNRMAGAAQCRPGRQPPRPAVCRPAAPASAAVAGRADWLAQPQPLLAQLGERWLGWPPRASCRSLRRGRICRQRLRPSWASAACFVGGHLAGLFQPHIAMAAQAVLHAAGYQVHVLRPLADDAEPARPLCCAARICPWARWTPRAKKPAGCTPRWRRRWPAARRLSGWSRRASCLCAMITSLGLGEDARQVARQVFLFEEFIAREHDRKAAALAAQTLDAAADAGARSLPPESRGGDEIPAQGAAFDSGLPV